jgi:TatD DNase family protein
MPDVFKRASGVGVSHIVAVGTDVDSSTRVVNMAGNVPPGISVEPAVGIHPSNATRFDAESAAVLALVATGRARAVGEIGLDYYRHPETRATQRAVFRAQLGWASEHDLPVIVHNRQATRDVLDDVKNAASKGVLHCFTGNHSEAEEALALGLYISFACNLTYPKNRPLLDVATAVPLDRLLVETDSPFLAPQDLRGCRNEPANVSAVALQIAAARGIDVEEVAEETSRNAARLFGWASG